MVCLKIIYYDIHGIAEMKVMQIEKYLTCPFLFIYLVYNFKKNPLLIINRKNITHPTIVQYLGKNRSHSQNDIDFLKSDMLSTCYFSKMCTAKLYIHMRFQHFDSKYRFIFHTDRLLHFQFYFEKRDE